MRRTVAEGARDRSPISGYTHNFYRYPARFSPTFAAAAIEAFTKPGDLICEPYMGGGTAIVQSLAMGRHAVGNDLNSLSHFITKVKITPLDRSEVRAVLAWAEDVAPNLTYSQADNEVEEYLSAPETKNLELTRGRFIKRVIAAGLASLDQFPTRDAKDFVRCVMLRVSQWALDGKKTHTTLDAFREQLVVETSEMLAGMESFSGAIEAYKRRPRATLRNGDAGDIDTMPIFAQEGRRARLVITSPPYPGVHVLYHRWQVDGRRETPAPYWIAGCKDGEGSAFYNFGDRRASGINTYFDNSLRTLKSIRNTLTDDGIIVQMVAFGDPERQLPQYLANMEEAGFREYTAKGRRIWRTVPHRKWHATQQKKNHSSKEVVLIHTPA
jgi:DNA modification methylase